MASSMVDLDLPSLYTQRVIKEYQLAFDMAVRVFQSEDKPILAAVPSAQWAVEITRRSESQLSLLNTSDFEVQEFINAVNSWAQTELSNFDANDQQQYQGIIWVMPKKQTLNQTIKLFDQIKAPDLVLISPGWLNRFLPENEIVHNYHRNFASNSYVCRMLKKYGWELQNSIGLHGLLSIAYSIGSRIADSLSRPDWRDRLIFSSRSVYKERGFLRPLSTVTVSIFTKSID